MIGIWIRDTRKRILDRLLRQSRNDGKTGKTVIRQTRLSHGSVEIVKVFGSSISSFHQGQGLWPHAKSGSMAAIVTFPIIDRLLDKTGASIYAKDS